MSTRARNRKPSRIVGATSSIIRPKRYTEAQVQQRLNEEFASRPAIEQAAAELHGWQNSIKDCERIIGQTEEQLASYQLDLLNLRLKHSEAKAALAALAA